MVVFMTQMPATVFHLDFVLFQVNHHSGLNVYRDQKFKSELINICLLEIIFCREVLIFLVSNSEDYQVNLIPSLPFYALYVKASAACAFYLPYLSWKFGSDCETGGQKYGSVSVL